MQTETYCNRSTNKEDKMQVPKPIFSLQGVTPVLGKIEIASQDVKSLQQILTDWHRAGGNGFISRIT